jgi:16S rRNA (uracil1498-N3)-methyltransferase
MTHLRFFVDNGQFSEGDLVYLEDKEFHHARDVVRVGTGESIVLINGHGGLASGIVESIERHRCTVRVTSATQERRVPSRLFLAISLLRPSHLDFAIEKATELGIDAFVIFPSQKSEKHECSTSMQRRLSSIAVAATKQSGRLFLPEITTASSLQEALSLLPSPHFWADLGEDALPIQEVLAQCQSTQPHSLLIGPESGWSTKEQAMLRHERPPVRLHHLVLRAETAAIVAAYAMSLQ